MKSKTLTSLSPLSHYTQCQSRSVDMHRVFRHPSQSWSVHLSSSLSDAGHPEERVGLENEGSRKCKVK